MDEALFSEDFPQIFKELVIRELLELVQARGEPGLDIPQEVQKILQDQQGPAVARMFSDVCHMPFSETLALEHFAAFLEHWAGLHQSLGRDVCLNVAALDYFEQAAERFEPHLRLISQEQLRDMEVSMERDRLTGLYNFAYYKRRLAEEISICSRYRKHFALVVIDIDDFKKYNDSFGHDEGNVVLKNVARVLQETLRASDIVFRYGGEEFVLLLTQTTKQGALTVMERARKNVQALNFKRQVTISVGVSAFPYDGQSAEQLFEQADKALYKAKSEGKNRVCLYHQERRHDPRLEAYLPLTVCLQDGSQRADLTKMKDLSRGGLSFYSSLVYPPGEDVRLYIEMGDDKVLDCQGHVLWMEQLSDELNLLGVQFTQISREQQRLIQERIVL